MSMLSTLAGAQPHATAVLTAALSSERCHHAYLLTGRNVHGATAVATAFAQSLVCQDRRGVDACGECAACRKLTGGNHPDVLHIAPDEKGKIGIDVIREVASRLSLCAAESATKVVVMEQADRMLAPAQNALLKTLEEPPGATCFLICVARPKMLLATVRSRCQRIVIAPADRAAAAASLGAGGAAHNVIAVCTALAAGDVLRAQAMLDGPVADIVADLTALLGARVVPSAVMDLAANYGGERDDADQVLAVLEVLVRDRLAAKFGGRPEQLYLGMPEGPSGESSALSVCATFLRQLRRSAALNLNRTFSLEHALFCAAGLLS